MKVIEKAGSPWIVFSSYEKDEDGDIIEMEFEIPARYEVCEYCAGTGKSSAYLGAFTQSEMEEQGPEFMEDYFAGVYDKVCPECQGKRVVAVPDQSFEDELKYRKAFQLYYEKLREEDYFQAMRRSEMRMTGDY